MIHVSQKRAARSQVIEVFLAFLKLGLTSFGGPIAHIGFFRSELVARRGWLTESQFSQLLAICQFIPGPASSQLGFCIGLHRAGWLGALAAFLAFTLPSVLLLIAFATALPLLSSPIGVAVIHGLKLVACAIVADAVLGMSQKLCPDLKRKIIAILVMISLMLFSTAWASLLVILLAAVVGVIFLPNTPCTTEQSHIHIPFGRKLGGFLLLLFGILLIALPLLVSMDNAFFAVADAFYRAGALVFGGGHVVLPLLQESTVGAGWLTQDQFLAGYGASQAIPGPMFAFSAYLGTLLFDGENPWLIATTALCFMFIPGFLLVAGCLPFWRAISRNQSATRAITAVNAAVVGLLGAALYHPIMTSGISNFTDLVIVVVAFSVLVKWRISPLLLVIGCVVASVVMEVVLR
ncbi:chromate ion family chromate transporter [Psychromonas sp. psych-6C06]|uniref:chromate efflux transporter n=1 Tax=Psychromonas sp. psych-6C06 TaxID=2058089 RepID=UPI000C3261CB|nr:chromate efflux transporter [Psychromonas sp. psych-6C06]PKF63537.1 chromate ion family chromate transporter [Psychromonas sp. psych-6C06]